MASVSREFRRQESSEFLKDPVSVHIGDTKNQLVASKNITQVVRMVHSSEKVDELLKLVTEINTDSDGFAIPGPGQKILIFSGTKRFTAELGQKLRAEGHKANAIHGDLMQWERIGDSDLNSKNTAFQHRPALTCTLFNALDPKTEMQLTNNRAFFQELPIQ